LQQLLKPTNTTHIMGQETESDAVAVAVPATSSVMVPPGSSVVKPPGASAVAVPMGAPNANVPMWQQEKQGAKCCGCCCDYRRAVIVLAIINICISAAYIVMIVAAAATPGIWVNLDDDSVQQTFEDAYPTQLALYAVTLFCAICALVGANKFNIPLVMINTLWYVGSFIGGTIVSINLANDVNDQTDDGAPELMVVPNIIVSAVITMLFMYPHIGFMYEVKVGIMSYETYPREEYSCCCAPAARRY
jgi:hypothetical protein